MFLDLDGIDTETDHISTGVDSLGLLGLDWVWFDGASVLVEFVGV